MPEAQNITITKKENSLLSLNTANKYITDDIKFNINVQPAVVEFNTSLASTVQSTSAVNSGKNIAEAIGEKSLSEPNDGYFIRVQTTSSNSIAIQQSGWMEHETIPEQTENETSFYPVNEAAFSKSGSLTIIPTVQLSQSNVQFSDVDNGVQVVAVGGATGTMNATFSTIKSGYAEQHNEQINSTKTETNAMMKFISGVSLSVPQFGTASFSVHLPDERTFMFLIDANGTITIEQ